MKRYVKLHHFGSMYGKIRQVKRESLKMKVKGVILKDDSKEFLNTTLLHKGLT